MSHAIWMINPSTNIWSFRPDQFDLVLYGFFPKKLGSVGRQKKKKTFRIATSFQLSYFFKTFTFMYYEHLLTSSPFWGQGVFPSWGGCGRIVSTSNCEETIWKWRYFSWKSGVFHTKIWLLGIVRSDKGTLYQQRLYFCHIYIYFGSYIGVFSKSPFSSHIYNYYLYFLSLFGYLLLLV